MSRDVIDRALAIPGDTEADVLAWLYERASGMASVVEIGCKFGRSACVLAWACPQGVTTIDSFEEGDGSMFAQAQNYMSFMAPGRVKFLAMDSVEAAKEIESVEMLFVDGDHSLEGVMRDLTAWTPKVSRLICGHDYDETFPGVRMAVDMLAAVRGKRLGLGPGSIWYMETVQQLR